MQLTTNRLICLLIGLAVRVGMLVWGYHQDAAGGLPYTDVDHGVFVRGATSLIEACPLSLVTSVEAKEEYEDLLNPPEALGRCAQGFVGAFSRFILQSERELLDPTICPFPEGSLPHRALHLSLAMFRPPCKLFAGLGDPYSDATYRYTPLLAAILAPAQLVLPPSVAQWAPKTLFVLADLACALLMWAILDLMARRKARALGRPSTVPGSPDDTKQRKVVFAAHAEVGRLGWVPALWLFNPLPIGISTRGSSEALLGVLVLGFLYTTLHSTPGTSPESTLPTPPPRRGSLTPIKEASASVERLSQTLTMYGDELPNVWRETPLAAPLLLAAATHFKLYPAIYAIPTLAHLLAASSARSRRSGMPPSVRNWGLALRFAGIAAYAFFGLFGICYAIWGTPYIRASILHHLTRLDVRHNFSPTFLPAYLSSVASPDAAASGALDGVDLLGAAKGAFIGFAPQLSIVALLGWTLGGRDLVAACAAQTLAFVAFNKVSTSQYFMWFLWFLPLMESKLVFGSKAEPMLLIAAWVGVQAIWLQQAYNLEFLALDTFMRTWTAGLALLAVHAIVLASCVRAWGRGRVQQLEAL